MIIETIKCIIFVVIPTSILLLIPEQPLLIGV